MKKFISKDLIDLAKIFEKYAPLYVVGGFVRDAIAFKVPSKDIDLASSLSPDEVKTILSGTSFKVFDASPRLGTLIIKGISSYEYTAFRTDSYPQGKGDHSPMKVVFTKDITQDALRRDFKCNAIYYDIVQDKIVDPLNGVKDIEEKKLETVQDAEVVLSQDGLRIMRLVRMVSTLGYKIEEKTYIAAKKLVKRLEDISIERIQVELTKTLQGDNVYKACCYMRDLGILDIIIPELAQAKGILQNPLYHKYDVLEHTFKTVEAAPKEIRLAALFHDIAKASCLKRDGNMYMHAIEGTKMTREILSRLRYSNEIIQKTATLVEAHMIDLSKNTKVNKLRAYILNYYPYIEDIVKLQKADAIGTGMAKEEDIVNRLEEQYVIMKENKLPFCLKDLKINGKDLLNIGYQGKQIQIMLEEILYQCAIEKIKNSYDDLMIYAQKRWRKIYGNSNT